MRVVGIAAMGRQLQVGLNNELPWRCPEDLKLFKELTMNHIVVVGWNTKSKLPPLTGRVVMADNCNTDAERQGFLDYYENQKVIYIIGGPKTWKKWQSFITEWHLSIVPYEGEADAYFPCQILDFDLPIHLHNFTDEDDEMIMETLHAAATA